MVCIWCPVSLSEGEVAEMSAQNRFKCFGSARQRVHGPPVSAVSLRCSRKKAIAPRNRGRYWSWYGRRPSRISELALVNRALARSSFPKEQGNPPAASPDSPHVGCPKLHFLPPLSLRERLRPPTHRHSNQQCRHHQQTSTGSSSGYVSSVQLHRAVLVSTVPCSPSDCFAVCLHFSGTLPLVAIKTA